MNTYDGIKKGRITDYLANKALQMKIPLCGTFELSPVCNFSCKMCYVRKTKKEVAEHSRSILQLEDWLAIAAQAREKGPLYLLLTGGEPLLWPHFWTLYEQLVDMGFLVSVNTNGALIDDDAIARFQKRPPQKLNITLYGANNETYQRLCNADGVFSKVDHAIRQLIASKITVTINCSLTPSNAKDLDWIIDYAKEQGAALRVATYMFPPVRRDPAQIGENERFGPEDCARYLLRYLERERGPEAYRRYLENIVKGCIEPPGLDEGCIDPLDGKIRCRAGRSSFWITWDGWLTACGMMPVPKLDLKALAFPDAWTALVDLSAQLSLSGICRSCPNSDVCHPCAAIAYAETGKVSEIPVYMCKVSKQMQKIARDTLRTQQITNHTEEVRKYEQDQAIPDDAPGSVHINQHGPNGRIGCRNR